MLIFLPLQLCLTFTTMKAGVNKQDGEVIISGQKTVRELLQAVTEKSGEQGMN